MKNLTIALIGDPISHSLSPIIYPRLGRAMGINITYLAYTVTKEDAPVFIDRLIDDGVDAINITAPLKTLFGGNNLIVNRNHAVPLHNTDANAFRASYAKYMGGKKKALIVGTGGVVNGVAGVLKDLGMHVTVAGRAEEMPKRIVNADVYVDIYTYGDPDPMPYQDFDVVVWAIPATYCGYQGNKVENKDQVFIDLRYGTWEVWWSATPENWHNGLEMVINNAMLTLEKLAGPLDESVHIAAHMLHHELEKTR